VDEDEIPEGEEGELEADEDVEAEAEPEPEEEPTDPRINLRALVEERTRARRALTGEVTVKRAGGDVRLVLDRASTLIGRDNDCDIVVDEQEVSRKHARLVHNQKGYFELIDLSSTNGTLNGGYAVPRMVLADGDSFQIGATEFVLHLVEEEAPPE
jgi:pSer/pThr/pTyr-binding forkhead associated (FHA) protein